MSDKDAKRREALSLLDHLSRDSLEQPLAISRAHPEQGDISATFARLADLIEELSRGR